MKEQASVEQRAEHKGGAAARASANVCDYVSFVQRISHSSERSSGEMRDASPCSCRRRGNTHARAENLTLS